MHDGVVINYYSNPQHEQGGEKNKKKTKERITEPTATSWFLS